MQNITKRFGEKIIANKSINFSAQKGEIHALVGENGAGKTTLMNILAGMQQPDEGIISLNGTIQTLSSPSKAIKLGIGMLHQHFMLVKTLSVLENIILGSEPIKNLYIDNNSAKKKINLISKSFEINLNLNTKIDELSVGLQQRVEILKILFRNAEIMILDEPTAVLSPQEIDELFSTLNELKNHGKTIILITHKLDEVLNVSDKITILRQGEVKGNFITKKTNKEEIVNLMVGSDIKKSTRLELKETKEIILRIENLFVQNDQKNEIIKNLSLEIRKCEILGLAGVAGNGQNELIDTISSLRKSKAGRITINRKKHYTQKCAHLPADRLKYGIVLDMDIAENLLLGRERENYFSSPLKMHSKNIRSYASTLIKDYDIQTTSLNQKIKELSGGNQQKVVAARELSKDTELIIANQPTRGLDIKATEFVHQIILDERRKGKAIFLISSDLSEIFELSDKIAVIFKGEILKIFDTRKTNEREVGFYMMGGNQ